MGVDPAEEATVLEERYLAAGYRRRVRVDGETHSALSMEHLESGDTLVRVVSRSGVALALEAPSTEHDRAAVGLLDPGRTDLDGDGAEEVLVYAIDEARARRCVAIVRIDDMRVREVRIPFDDLGGEACIEDVRDVGGDARPEALVVVRYPEWSAGTPPQVAVPYAAPSWTRMPRGAARAFLEEERASRQEGLAEARRTQDVREAFRLGVELAALARFSGAEENTQIEALEAATTNLELPGPLRARIEEVTARIRAGWRRPELPEVLGEEREER